MKKNFIVSICFFLFFILSLPLNSVSLSGEKIVNASDLMLSSHFSEGLQDSFSDSEYEYWEKTKVALITISKGDSVYQWFGHTAILVETPDMEPLVFNYGYFSFSDGFYVNFAMGRLLYNCDLTFLDYEIRRSEYEKRTMSEISLNLSPEMKKAIFMYLQFNITKPNNVYLYHYYDDNCATRIRDLINYATEGRLKNWAVQKKGLTYREHNSSIFAQNCFVLWVLDFLQGPAIDNKNATLWEEMYLPSVLRQAILSFPNLAGEEKFITDFRETDTRFKNLEKPLHYSFWCFLVFSFISACLIILSSKCRRLYNIFSFIVLLILGILSAVLFFMMNFTTHDVTWNNENIIFLNPLIIFTAFLSLNSKKHEKLLAFLWAFHLLSVVFLLIFKLVLPQIFFQHNFEQIMSFLPLASANVFVYKDRLKTFICRIRLKRTVK